MKTAYLVAAAKDYLIPHWGKIFTYEEVYNLLKEEEFKYVKDKTGRAYSGIQVSESKKWLKVSHKYYPIPLIAHFYPKFSIFCLIDGSYINMDLSLDSLKANDEMTLVTKLFGTYAYKDGENPDKVIMVDHLGNPAEWQQDFWYQRAFVMLKREIEKDSGSIALTDWKMLRYNWERTLADIEYTSHSTETEKKKYYLSLIRSHDTAFEAMNSSVLDDDAIAFIAKAIKNGRNISLDKLLDKKAYKDPLYVCNCIRVLEKLDDSERLRGIHFLIDCMDAIDEPYYVMASDLLAVMPEDKVIPALEENFRFAINSEDVLRIAGLMALADRLEHELVQE